MKKSILNLGKALNKTEQKKVNGGGNTPQLRICECDSEGTIINKPCESLAYSCFIEECPHPVSITGIC